MRIVSGRYKGKRITVPKSFKARPTTDFAKENLFNVLANQVDFEALHILDLFAGTGSIGFEFASRNALSVDSVEHDFKSVKHIQQISHELEFTQLKAYRDDVFRFIKRTEKKYDLIFADPPYALKNIDMLPEMIFVHGLLNKNGSFILEHGSDKVFTSNAHFKEIRKYGSVHFSLFHNQESNV